MHDGAPSIRLRIRTRVRTEIAREAHSFYRADVRDIDTLDALLAQIEREAGRLDVLINNAGGAPFALAAQASPRFTEAVIRLNLLAPLQLAQRANALMQRQATGRRVAVYR